jgi:polysaccharide pyruvyl transferase WcaK-like protein
MLTGLMLSCKDTTERFVIAAKQNAMPPRVAKMGVKTIESRLLPILWELWACHGLILGGGTHFHDDYAWRRNLRHSVYMLRIVLICLSAKLLGKKVLWLGMGFGPFVYLLTRWITQSGFMQCDFVTTRDAASIQEIQGWGSAIDKKLTRGFDLAACCLEDNDCAFLISEKYPRRNILGISVTSVRSTRTGGTQTDDCFWENFCIALSEVLAQTPDLTVRIFVIRGGTREGDGPLSLTIYQRLKDVDPLRVELVEYNPDPIQTLLAVAECRAFVATRFHAAVLAYLARCDLLIIPYHRKLNDLLEEIQLSSQACLMLDKNVTSNVIADKLRDLVGGLETFVPRLPVEKALKRAQVHAQTVMRFSNTKVTSDL